MAIESNDALTKLSANLAMYRNFHKDEDRVNDYILTKAQRIVAELEKVRTKTVCGVLQCDGDELFDAFENCRAIAEE